MGKCKLLLLRVNRWLTLVMIVNEHDYIAHGHVGLPLQKPGDHCYNAVSSEHLWCGAEYKTRSGESGPSRRNPCGCVPECRLFYPKWFSEVHIAWLADETRGAGLKL
jgi:hypothetical protein